MMNLRADFPILHQNVGGRQLVYLDSAATSQRPRQVLEAVEHYDRHDNGNPHRGSHTLSMRATEAYEQVRDKVRDFLNAGSREEVIFTKNATEAINLVGRSHGLRHIKAGDTILISIAEHHSNLVVWQQVAKTTGAKLEYMYVDQEGRLPEKELEKIGPHVKFVGITHMSNVLGTIFPVQEIIRRAHGVGALVLVDGAQSVPHMKVDVRAMDADFFVFSGHKMLSMMGVGVLYGKRAHLEAMDPFLFGGDMIEYVHEQETSFNALPYRFEAGTPNVEAVVSLGAAIDYLHGIGFEAIHAHEAELTAYALRKLQGIPHLTLLGPTDEKERGSVISFIMEGVHPHDVATIADSYGVGIRAGHHCAQPLMRYLGVAASSRASFSFYNTKEDIDALADALSEVRRWMGYGA